MVGVAVAAVAASLLVCGVLVYVLVRDRLLAGLQERLHVRAAMAADLAEGASPRELADRLSRSEMHARIDMHDGRSIKVEPSWLVGADVDESAVNPRFYSTVTELPDEDGTLTLFMPRNEVDAALRQLLAVEVITVVLSAGLVGVMLAQLSRTALAPVDAVVHTALAIAEGDSHRRLRPTTTRTELGRMAAAFDHMLDALSAALARARAADARSQRFLADAAHQLRAPIASAQSAAEGLLMGWDAIDRAERERLVDVVAVECARSGDLVGDLLLLANLDAEQAPSVEQVDVAALLEDEAARLQTPGP